MISITTHAEPEKTPEEISAAALIAEIESSLQATLPSIKLNQILVEIETYCLKRALELSQGNKAEAARILHLHRTTFHEKLRKWCPDLV